MKSLEKRRSKRHNGELGALIKARRHEKGYSLSELSDMTGLSRSYIGEIETGKKGFNLPMHTVAMLAQALDLAPSTISSKMEVHTAIDARKYGEHYRVLRSNVRAGRIAQLLGRLKADIEHAKSALMLGKDASKYLQDIERTVNAVDNTLAYRGKPPVSVTPAADKGDDEKFLDLGKLG